MRASSRFGASLIVVGISFNPVEGASQFRGIEIAPMELLVAQAAELPPAAGAEVGQQASPDGGGAVVEPAEEKAPETDIGSGQAALVSVAGECSLEPTTGAFSASQSGSVKDHLFDVRFENCQFERTGDSIDILSLETRWQFDLAANVNHCSALSVAFLFEVSSDTPGFTWTGERRVVSDLPLRNLSGNDQNANFFQLYSTVSATSVTVADVLVARATAPNFDHIYWGNVILLKEPITGELGRAIQHHLPVVGKNSGVPDFSFKLRVAIADPRGWCFDPGSKGARTNLVFSAIKAGAK